MADQGSHFREERGSVPAYGPYAADTPAYSPWIANEFSGYGPHSDWFQEPVKSPEVSPYQTYHTQLGTSVKNLTCYFWATQGSCKWSDDDCLYAHYDTGRISNAPLQVEQGRPAVAGRNASAPRPVYQDWRMEYSRRVIDPEIQLQIDNIKAKAKETSPTPVKSERTNANIMLETTRNNTADPQDLLIYQHMPNPMISPPAAYQPIPPRPTPITQAQYQASTGSYHSDQNVSRMFSPPGHTPTGSDPRDQDAHGNDEAAMGYHLASYHAPTASHGGLYQLLCPRPSDHIHPHSAIDNEMLHNMVAKTEIISELAKALDSAIANLESLRRTTTEEVDKLVKLAKDDRFEIKYIGGSTSTSPASGSDKTQVRYGETPDFRNKIVGVGENVMHMQGLHERAIKQLRDIKDQVGTQMENIGAASQLPSGWVQYHHE